MNLILGLALVAISIGVFWASLPRHGKTAKFVGTEWEGYIVAGLIGVLGIGAVMIVSGLVQLRA